LEGCYVALRFAFLLLALPYGLFAQAPGLSSTTPSSGMQGSTIGVSITGSGFVDGSTQLSATGGVLVSNMSVLDSTHINALLVLNGPPGFQDVRVNTANGASNAFQFDVVPSALDSATSFHVDRMVGVSPGAVDGTGHDAKFYHPNYLWGDGVSLYVSDNQAVRKVDLATARVTTLAGVQGEAGFVDGIGNQARFTLLLGIWSDRTSVYVLDEGNGAIRKIDIQTGAVTTLAKGLKTYNFDSAMDGLWGDGTYLYVTQTIPKLLLRVEIATGNVTTFAAFSYPHGVSGDSTNLYIADAATLRQVSIGGAQVTTLASIDPENAVWQDDVAFYFTTNTGVSRLDRSTGTVTLIAGDRYTLGAADGNGTTARFNLAKGIWGNGRELYVVDWGNNAIRRITLATGDVATFAGSITDQSIIDGDRGTARFASIYQMTSDGLNLYVTDQHSLGTPQRAIRKINIATGQVSSLSTAGAGAMWSDGEFLYYSVASISGGGEIRKLRIATGEVTVVAGKLLSGDFNPVDGPVAVARFPNPQSIWGNGESLFVADAVLTKCTYPGSSCLFPRAVSGIVRQISLASGLVTTLSTGALPPYAQGQMWGDGQYLYFPGQVAIYRISVPTGSVSTINVNPGSPGSMWGDGTYLYMADRQTVKRVDLVTGTVSTIMSADTGLLQPPTQIWGDGAHLYVANYWMIQQISADGFQPMPASSSPFTVIDRGGVTVNTTASTTLNVGYATLQANRDSVNPSGVAVIQYRPAGVTVTEAAVSASPLVQSGRIYAEVSGSVNTGIAIANPNSQPATLSFMFTDAAGVNFGAGSATIPANGQIARFLNEAPFSPGASVQNARSFTFNSSVPLAVVALRGYTNERSDFLITTLPVSALGSGSTQPLYFPHFASGGGWTTSVVLVNPTDATLRGFIRFASSQPLDPFPYTIAPRSSLQLQIVRGSQTVTVGWIEVVPEAASSTPSGLTIFSFKNNGITVSETGVPAVPLSQTFQTYVENSGAFGSPSSLQTGLAIANPAQSDITVSLDLFTLDGQPFGNRGSLTIPASSEIPIFLTQVPAFQNLTAGFEGIVRVSTDSPQGISVIGLRAHYNERGDFLVATLPVIPKEAAPSSEVLFFPQIASGGGYVTRLMLFSGTDAQPTSGSIRFFSQTGGNLNAISR